jgi:hypothetical protein
MNLFASKGAMGANNDTFPWILPFERATLRLFSDVRKGYALKDICGNGAMREILRRGTVLEFQYLDRRGAQLGSFVVRAGDCT